VTEHGWLIREINVELFAAYKKVRNETVTSIRNDKVQYQKKLVKCMKNCLKTFYSYVRSKQKNPETVSKVSSAEDKISENDRETAQFLSNQFRKVYADHGYTDLVNLVSSLLEELNASELFAEHMVHKQLCMLNDSTSPRSGQYTSAFVKALCPFTGISVDVYFSEVISG